MLKPLSIDSSVSEGLRDSFFHLVSCFCLTPFSDLYFPCLFVEKVKLWSPKSDLEWGQGGELIGKGELFSAGDPRLPKGGPGRPKGGPGRPAELQKAPKMDQNEAPNHKKSKQIPALRPVFLILREPCLQAEYKLNSKTITNHTKKTLRPEFITQWAPIIF